MSCLIRAFLPGAGRRNRDENKPLLSLIEARKWFLVKQRLERIEHAHSKSICTSISEDDGGFGHLAANSAQQASNNKHPPTETEVQTNTHSEIKDGNNETILHSLCRNQPPLDIIKLINEKHPQFVSTATTKEDHYPVHIACKYGAHPDVISYLVSQHPFAASASSVDCDGRTTLHLICSGYSKHYKVVDMIVRNDDESSTGTDRRKRKNRKKKGTNENPGDGKAAAIQKNVASILAVNPLSAKDAMLKSVRVLTRTFPDIVDVNDLEDMTALEYAICGNFHMDVVKSLQRASERYFRAQKKKHLARDKSTKEDQGTNVVHNKNGQEIIPLNGDTQDTSAPQQQQQQQQPDQVVKPSNSDSIASKPETNNQKCNDDSYGIQRTPNTLSSDVPTEQKEKLISHEETLQTISVPNSTLQHEDAITTETADQKDDDEQNLYEKVSDQNALIMKQ